MLFGSNQTSCDSSRLIIEQEHHGAPVELQDIVAMVLLAKAFYEKETASLAYIVCCSDMVTAEGSTLFGARRAFPLPF